MTSGNFAIVVALALGCGIVDASFGMGYGTVLTPVLLLLGFDAVQVVPAVIASQLVGDVLAVFFHHRAKNVDMSIGSSDFKVGMVLALFSLLGSVIAVLFSLKISKFALNLYIGVLVAVVGVVVLISHQKDRDFSWLRLLFLGSIASFNKGLSGGGYGPIVTAGQLLTGIGARAAIGITSLAEAATCVAAFATHLFAGSVIDWNLTGAMAIGMALSTPIAALIVKKMESKHLKLIIGVLTLILGAVTIFKTVRAL
ncbi:MAG: sulfite exporter TauE/SafE family protein [Anaerolineales bacterium]|nr:sulfite exporter TauE/SafE family protein [Anaerolineales bacterium]